MTINGTNAMTMNDSLGHKVDKRCKHVKCTNKDKWWSSATVCAKELNVNVKMVYAVCEGKVKTCNGLELSYEENVTEVRNKQSATIGKQDAKIAELEAKLEAMQADAELGRKVRLEQEEARKAEEKRAKAIAKADEKIARRQRMYDRKMEEVKHAYSRLEEAKREREALEAM